MDSQIISDQFANSYKNKKVPWGFNGLGYIVYKRTYSRIKLNGQNEEWYETIQRCINGAQEIGAQYTKEEAEQLFDLIFNLKCNFAGRMLWQLGTDTVKKFGLPSLCNCWFVSITEPEDFCFIFEHLMLGGGVGFSIKREDIHELPKVKKDVKIIHDTSKDAEYIIPDSRRGWVQLLRNVLNSYFVTGESFSYSTILVRGAGEPIKGFGGTASGPKILTEGLEAICKILISREGKKLRSIDVLDICNLIGSIVVAGNVRRSAEVALGDPDDYLYLKAKNWSSGEIPNWRAMSNNSIYADKFEHISNDIWSNGYEIDAKTGLAKGEPYGFLNIKLAQSKARLKDNKKDTAQGGNPCMEAMLESHEPCDLAELYLNNISSLEELILCSKLLYKTQKVVLTLPSISKKTEKVVKRNMRIGLGITGICQSLNKIEWLSAAYEALRDYDKEWSKERGWPESIRLTVVKPSGTLSILGNASPGVHPIYSKYFIRRVRIASGDKLVKICRDFNYPIEYLLNFDKTEDRNTVVVSFPCFAGDNVIEAKEMSAIKQLELVKTIQTEWADQSVSVTVYYEPEELTAIKEWMKENYETSLKTVSFLLKSKHGFDQAPYEEITKEKYLELKSKVRDLTNLNIEQGEMENLEGCAGGVCPIR